MWAEPFRGRGEPTAAAGVGVRRGPRMTQRGTQRLTRRVVPRAARVASAAPAARADGTPEPPYLALHRAARRRVEMLDDVALVAAMRAWDERAWDEFVRRFRPLLVDWARRARVPDLARETCVDDVLSEEGERLMKSADTPSHLGAYLQRAARSRLLNERRGQDRRERRQMAVAERAGGLAGDWVVTLLQSEHVRRAAAGDDPGLDVGVGADAGDLPVTPSLVTPAVLRMGVVLRAGLPERDRRLLDYMGEDTPYRLIAALLETSPEAIAMRVSRLHKRLRARALEYAAALPLGERDEVERFLRSAGVRPPLVAGRGPATGPPTPKTSRRHPRGRGEGGGGEGGQGIDHYGVESHD